MKTCSRLHPRKRAGEISGVRIRGMLIRYSKRRRSVWNDACDAQGRSWRRTDEMQYSLKQGRPVFMASAEQELRSKMAQRKISIKTPLDPEKLLIRSATITEQLAQPFEINVELLSPDEHIDFDTVLGQELQIALALHGDGERHFHSYIKNFDRRAALESTQAIRPPRPPGCPS
jgi:hypothetical protein